MITACGTTVKSNCTSAPLAAIMGPGGGRAGPRRRVERDRVAVGPPPCAPSTGADEVARRAQAQWAGL